MASRLETFFKMTTSSGSNSVVCSKPSKEEGVEGREVTGTAVVAPAPTNCAKPPRLSKLREFAAPAKSAARLKKQYEYVLSV